MDVVSVRRGESFGQRNIAELFERFELQFAAEDSARVAMEILAGSADTEHDLVHVIEEDRVKYGQRELDVAEVTGTIDFVHGTRPAAGHVVFGAERWRVHAVGSRVAQAVEGFRVRDATNAHRLQLFRRQNPEEGFGQETPSFGSFRERHDEGSGGTGSRVLSRRSTPKRSPGMRLLKLTWFESLSYSCHEFVSEEWPLFYILHRNKKGQPPLSKTIQTKHSLSNINIFEHVNLSAIN